MSWKNIRLVFLREVRDQLRDRRTLFMITILPVLLYPMLGLGIVEMMLTFSEQPRVVVILNADDLPTSPALLDQSGIGEEWFENGAEETSKLRVLAERTPQAGNEEKSARRPRRGEKTDEELLAVAHQLAEKIETLHGLRTVAEESMEATATPQPTSAESPESNTSSTISSTDKTAEAASTEAKLTAAQNDISQQFGTSGFQVLVIIPKGYRAAMEAMQREIQTSSSATTGVDAKAVATRVPPVLVVRNSADDKSMVAFGRVQKALQSWEDSVRKFSFEQAGLPKELQHPARLAWIEVALEEQVAASVWSKMFPALLVIMALTGAFYPAIDLGAGEKERGTMETLLISPAKRVELVLGKFATIMLFSTATALLNLLSMGLTGQQMSAVMSDGMANRVSLDFPGLAPLAWLVILLLPLSALFSALCLALATFARSTKEGQYYLTPLLMVVMGLTMFCLSPAVEMTPLYSVIPVVNVALLLKGLLLNSASSGNLVVYAIPVLISSIGYSMLALWWAIELYNSEDVLFREAEKFDIRMWFRQLLRTKDAVPALPEAGFCFILILMLQFVAMTYMKPDLTNGDPGLTMMRLIVIQQLTMIACPAVFMGMLLTTSLRATFRLRMPSITAMALGVGLAIVAHPLTV